jgi:diguanylate cyclase (GGDEF)-like protein
MQSQTSGEQEIGIGKPIIVGFIVILTLMIALIFIGLTFVAEANKRLHTVVENQNVKTQLANAIQTALAQRALSMHAVSVISDDFEKDAERLRFDAFGANYVQARDTIENMPLTPQEKSILANMRQLTKQARPELEMVMELALAGEQQTMLEKLRSEAMPRQRRISEQADAFIDLQQNQAARAMRNADASYTRAKTWILILSVSTVSLGLLITYFVSRRVSAQGRQLAAQALYDSLTSLPNRLQLLERLEQKIAHIRQDGGSFAVMLMDLDRFKEVNDTLGHEFGDLLLQEVGARLVETMRPDDIIARLGGDEFVIVLHGLAQGNVANTAEKVLACLDQPFQIDQQSIDVSASLGIALFPEHGQCPSTLLREADIAMYVAKRGGGGFALYSPEQDKISRGDLSLKGELREAILGNQLSLHFQPKIDHRRHRVIGFEALARWMHPQRGFMPPDKFIPLAERAGLIGALTHWVLKEAIYQLAEFHAHGHRLSMAVNLSACNLHDQELVDRIVALLNETRIPPQYLVLEVTEGAVMSSPSDGIRNLHRLGAAGISIAIDDFGTGYSSLAYLKQLPVDELKIDKSFVMNMCNDENDAVIVRSTIDLAHNLGLKVTAEGVEDRETWEILTTLGCDTSQGYFMSKPQPADRLSQWLIESPWAVWEPTAFPDQRFWQMLQSV